MSASDAAKEALWSRRMLTELSQEVSGATVVYEDNQSCIAYANNPVFHKRTKHIDVKIHYVRELVLADLIELHYISTNQQVADIFFKPLGTQKFTAFRLKLLGC